MKCTQSAGAILVNKKGQVAVVNNRGHSWSFPKGHVEPDEAVIQAALREVYEETGIDNVQYMSELGNYERYASRKNDNEPEAEFKTITMYLFVTENVKLSPNDPENPEARWVDPDDVTQLLTHPKDKEFYESKKSEVLKLIKSNGLSTSISLYAIVVIDLLDANPFADVFEDETRYAVIGRNFTSLAQSIALANRLFFALNPKAETQTNWAELEGHDVRIYDREMNCLYKAHQKLSG